MVVRGNVKVGKNVNGFIAGSSSYRKCQVKIKRMKTTQFREAITKNNNDFDDDDDLFKGK